MVPLGKCLGLGQDINREVFLFLVPEFRKIFIFCSAFFFLLSFLFPCIRLCSVFFWAQIYRYTDITSSNLAICRIFGRVERQIIFTFLAAKFGSCVIFCEISFSRIFFF
jgi:hypothetical protein